MAKEKENEITPEEYLKKHGHDLPPEKYHALDLENLAEKGKRYGFLISKRGLHDDLHDLNPPEKVIYIALRLYANNQTHWCNPPMRLLAENLNLSRSAVQRWISVLEKKGFIKIEIKKGRGGKRFEYTILKW